MDTKILKRQNRSKNPGSNTRATLHTGPEPQTAPPKRASSDRLPRELKWFACQAVKLDEERGTVLLRSFPFFAFSLEHARGQLLEMAEYKREMPYTHIFQYGFLQQASGRLGVYKKEKNSINIATGAKR